ncbi:hypothetical protein [Sulfoacidibacillus ferrooxidans]|uniref:Uncharacterized protein n=1 Tax=Sulfoacidibacillus ferrooxidans TaxID=2005001 RepID=A0A9X1VDU8_9BACL|nr:hypothetical protein [Sulfoacidibacillus ferrooxidans]MCI0184237.1 hypothetical protein [Sulfoacidibacillus ferrooxidans]
MFAKIGDTVEIINDVYEDGVEKVACKGELGLIRRITENGHAIVEFEIGRVVTLHPICFKVNSRHV